MKKYILSILFGLTFTLSLGAQNDERSMALSFSPIGALLGGADFLYQVKLTDYLALTVPVSFYYDWSFSKGIGLLAKENNGISTTKAPIKYSAGLGAKFLLAAKGISDTFYLEPRLIFGYHQLGAQLIEKNRYKKIETSSYHLFPMVRFGWDWVYSSGIFLSLGLGAGLKILFDNKVELPEGFKNKDNRFLVESLLPSGRVAFAMDGEFKVGYAW